MMLLVAILFYFLLLGFASLNSLGRISILEPPVFNYRLLLSRGVVFRSSPLTFGSMTAIILLGYLINRKRALLSSKNPHMTGLIVFGCLSLYCLFAITDFPVSSASTYKAAAVGTKLLSETWNIHQGIDVGNVLITLIGVSIAGEILLSSSPKQTRNLIKLTFLASAFSLIAVRLYAAVLAISMPTSRYAHEWSNEAELLNLVNKHKIDGLLIASDLADPADNYLRGLRAVNLTSLSMNRFYMTNLIYGHYLHNDASLRLSNTRKFFQTSWSDWHEDFLSRNSISHILVSDRCPQAWSSQSFKGVLIDRSGKWTLYKYGRDGNAGENTSHGVILLSPSWPKYKNIDKSNVDSVPAPCLSNRT